MATWVLDTGVGVLIGDILALPGCTVKRSEFGTIGDEEHQARTSKHNPESPPPPGNPDNEVDAVDIPHAPDRGVDCAKITEAIRQSRDPRVYLVIFNGRQFSSYTKDGVPPFTWRPYSGDDMHRTHAHVEVNDTHHGDTSHWKVVPTMAVSLESRYRAWLDMNADGKIDDAEAHPLYWFVVGAHFEAAKAAKDAKTAADGVALIEERVDRLTAAVKELAEAVKTIPVSLSAEQMTELQAGVLAGLRAKLSVDFVPQGTAE